jgi:DNA-binding CsgD family transcriptional regulator/tetratricopeptide (TPR) repeat protein
MMDLLERQTQLEELTRLLRDAAASTGKIALLRGEAGVGKSVLVEQFAQQAARGARVFWGHSDALQTSRVLGPVHELAAGLSVIRGTAGESPLSREQLFSRLFEKLSPPNPPAVVVLEDLHWADEATLDFVRFLGRRIQRTRCLLIATYRDDELSPKHLLRAVLGEIIGRHTTRIRIPPLSLCAVTQLTEGTQRNARQVHDVTGGNPFFVRELLSAPIDTVPETVRDAVLTRLMQCSPIAREITELVSLVPGRAECWLTKAVLGDIDAAADEAITQGLLRFQGHSLTFRHELGRLAVEGAIARSRAQALHRHILKVLIDCGGDLSRLVHHASHAQDEKAVLEYAPRAAQEASVAGAHREAAAHLATVLRHANALSATEHARFLEWHAKECDLTNQVSDALASANQALALWRELEDVAAQARVHLCIRRQHWKAGQNTLAGKHVADAIALLETLPPSRELAMAYSARSQLAMTSDHRREALEFGERALTLADQFEDQGARAHALNNIGCALLSSGDGVWLEKLNQSLAVALLHNLHEHAGRAYANLVSISVRQRRHDLAARYVPEGIAYCELHEVHDCLSYIRAYQAHLELDRGNWETAAQLASELLDHHAPAAAQRVPALIALGLVRVRRGDPGSELLLDEALQLALPTGELQRIGDVAAARAEHAWYQADATRVSMEVAVGLQATAESPDPWILGKLAYWGHRADPSFIVPAGIAEPYAWMISGEWKRAADAWEQLGMPYERALALADGPEEPLRDALVVLERLCPGPLCLVVRQRLRELGVRGVPRGPRASTRENPAGLTAREVEVLGMLVHGYTNTELARRLHVSAKTIDNHVAAILSKLQVRSRTEAVTEAFRLGITKPATPANAAAWATGRPTRLHPRIRKQGPS